LVHDSPVLAAAVVLVLLMLVSADAGAVAVWWDFENQNAAQLA
jgi:hypothetical protein